MQPERFRILLVEDNDGDVYLMRKALESAALNVELIVIDDGAEALTYARSEGKYSGAARPDAAVLDLNLPKADGTEVLEALRRNERFSEVPVVVLTSSASPAERLNMERLGVQHFFTKPPDLKDFLQIGHVIAGLLRRPNALEPP